MNGQCKLQMNIFSHLSHRKSKVIFPTFSQDLNKKISNKYDACEAHSIKMGSQAYLSCALRLRIVRTVNS